MDCMSGIAMSAFLEAERDMPSGGLDCDLGILRVGRPARPLSEAVPFERQVALGLSPQPGIGRTPSRRFQFQGQRYRDARPPIEYAR